MSRPCHPRSTPRSKLVLPILLYFFGPRMYLKLIDVSIYIASQVWARIVVFWTTWPWKLLGAPVDQREAMIRLFYASSTCCLDMWVSEPLRARFSEQDWLSKTSDIGKELQQLCLEIRRRLKVTNMHLERKLKEHKQSVPRHGGQLGAETLCYASLLGQVWRQHMDFNFTNPLVQTRDSMRREGCM